MKHLAVAAIVIAVLAADFGSNLWMADTDQPKAWSWWAGLSLVAAAWWFWHHRGEDYR